MSLPIPSSLVVQGASHLAGEVARRIGQAVGFADVLAGSPQTGGEEPESAADSPALREQLVQSIEKLLRESGISLNQPLQMRVQADGSMRLTSDHERGAEIEARLLDHADVQRLAQQWVAAQRPGIDSAAIDSAAIDLTIPASAASILPVPGGYPNW